MPIFEYKCKVCGEVFDHLVLSKNQQPPVCPKCGAENPAKLVSSFSTSGGTKSSSASSSAPT